MLPLLAIGCESNPTEVHDEELTVALTLSTDHVHILSPVTFTAVVRDGHGELVTDMDSLRVERKAVDSDTWRTAAELELSGTQYVGEYTFVSSGEYELRVLGKRAGHMGMEEMMMSPAMENVHAVPAHAEAGGIRIEFESFPGHIHEGSEIEYKFWLMEPERDPVTNERPPISGLAAEVHCVEPDGANESHAAVESETGVYTAAHTFVSAGEGSVEIHFTDLDGNPAEASFPLTIVHAH
ncbi:MAG: hypothetical protein GWN85_19945 [Gemmatimonadetes bacterium]|nr:hypothetical protein [Gemmatimonadota bacterium]